MSVSKSPNCAVIVNSCDKYAEVWPAFFSLFERFWTDCPFPVYLNTESKGYACPYPQVTVLNLTGAQGDAQPTWSARFLSALKRVEADFVLCLLEDFFLQAPVDTGRLTDCLCQMELHPDIAVFYMKKITGYDLPGGEYPDFSQMEGVAEYKFSCQAGL